MKSDLTKYFVNLEKYLIAAISTLNLPQKPGLLFSAGIDSSILAIMLKKLGYSPILYSVGTSLSKDQPYIEKFHEETDFENVRVFVDKNEVVKLVSHIQTLLSEHTSDSVKQFAAKHRRRYKNESTFPYPNPMDIAIGIGFYLIATHIDAPDIFVSGQGADDLFAGYNMFKGLESVVLQKALEKSMIVLRSIDIPRDKTIFESQKKQVVFPFLDRNFVEYALSIPPKFKFVGEREKYIWYKFGEYIGVPDIVTNRKKKAMQYSSGLFKWVLKECKM